MIESNSDETGVLCEHLLSVVRGHRLRWRLLHFVRGALEGVALACVFLAAMLVRARLGTPFGGPWLVVLCGLAVALPALVRLFVPVTVLRAALSIEHAFPFLQDRVATAVDLARRDHIPGGIARRVMFEADGALASLPLARALPTGVLRLGAALAGCGIAVLLAAWVLMPVCAESPVVQPPLPVAVVVAPQTPEPHLYDVSLTIEPPAYSGLPLRQLVPGSGAIRAPMGSRVTVGVTSEPPSAQVSLELAPGAALAMRQLGEGRAAVSLTLTERVVCGIVAEFVGARIFAPRFVVEPVADAAPSVRLVRPERDLSLDVARELEVAVTAADDFGVSAIGLRYRLDGESRWHSLRLDARPGASASASARLNPSAIGLRPGNSLRLCGWATDNDAFGGPKTSVSRTITIELREVIGPDPAATPVARAEDEQRDAFEQIQREAARFERELTEALGRLDGGESRGSLAEVSARLQEAAERLQQQAGALETSMRELEQQFALDEFISPELVEKVRELHQLMSEALGEDMRRALEELQRALEQADSEQMRMSLEQAREAQRRFMDRLDQTLDLLRRARLEVELQRLRKFAEELADRQQDLRDASAEDGDDRSRTAEADQRRLARDTEPLAERIAVAAEMARESSPQLSRDLDALAGEMMRRDPSGEMRQAASALGRSRPVAARDPQQRALDALRMAASRLAEAEEALTADLRAELTRAAAEMLRDALHLSRGQEELAAQTRRLSEGASHDLLRDKQRIGPLSRRQEVLAGSVERLGRRMDEMARATPAMDPSFGREIAAVAHDMRQAAREIDGARLGLADAMQGELVARLNDTARRLLELGDQMSQMSAQSMLGDYMQRLSELAERQRGMNQQTGQAADGQRQQGAQPGMGLPQLALEQAMIRAALEQMLRGAQGAEKQAADQLGGVAGAMEEVEGDLRRGRIERETLERQGRILEKMLDAQRSLYTRDPERAERQVERPVAYQPPPPPPPLSPSLLRSPEVRLSAPSSDGRLPAGFEEMVEAYFERLGGEVRP